MELVCLSEVGTPQSSSLGPAEVVFKESQAPEEGDRVENHCKTELLLKA